MLDDEIKEEDVDLDDLIIPIPSYHSVPVGHK